VIGEGRLVHPVRQRFAPVARATDLEVIRTAREQLRPPAESLPASPGISRVDLHTALVHQPTARHTDPGLPRP
jgi:hypothetical protein